jgi:hypothetical protein
MSLAVLADHMASKGRGPDSMLIHMSPNEVAGLQSLAMAHGGSLTVNPDTGLPEAGFLDKLLPTILGAGLSLIPGVGPLMAAGIVGGIQTVRTGDIGRGLAAGLGAYGGAGLAQGLSTAGAASIGGEAAGQSYLASAPGVLEGAGAGLSADMAYNLADAGVSSVGADAARQAAASAVEAATPFDKLSRGFNSATATPQAAGAFLKDNAKNLMYAAGPAIMAGANVQAKGPQTITQPGMIRPYSFDPYGGGFTAYPAYEATPKKAAEGGLMGMNAGGYAPGQLDFAQRSEPVVRMASGGIAGYAAGGPPTMLSDEELFKQTGSWEAAAAARDAQNNALNQYNWTQQAAPNAGSLVNDKQIFDYLSAPGGKTDAQIAADMQAFKVSAADIARVTGTQGQEADYNTRFVKAVALPGTDTTEFMNAASAVGLQDQALANALQNSGLSAAAQYALTHQHIGSDLNTAETQGGLEGLSNNINYALAQNKLTGDAGKIAALTEMNKYGINEDDVLRATGKTLAELFPNKLVCGEGYEPNAAGTACVKKTLTCGPGFELNAAGTACVPVTKKTLVCEEGYEPNAAGTACVKKTVVSTDTDTKTDTPFTCPTGYHKSTDGKSCVKDAPVIIDWKDCGTGYHWDKAAQACVKNIDATQNTTEVVTTPTSLITAADTTLPVGVSGTTGPSIFGGGATVNPNGTITTSPVIPGIPVGGFTGMEQVRDAYTAGGGSLGYIPYAPKTMAKFDAKYNKLTGGSKAAYDYLMGKTPYSPTPVTPTGQIFKPYSEAMGIPQDMTKRRYIFDPVTKTYKVNPDYKPPAYATAGASGSTTATGTTGATGSVELTDQAKKPETDPGPGNEWVWDYGGKKWIASPIEQAANGGLMAMARGGMAQKFDLGGYSDGGRLLRGPGDGVSDSIPATIGNKRPARLADGEFVVPARIVSELGNGSTEAGARKLYAMMDRVQAARRGTVGKGKVAKNSRADKHLPA